MVCYRAHGRCDLRRHTNRSTWSSLGYINLCLRATHKNHLDPAFSSRDMIWLWIVYLCQAWKYSGENQSNVVVIASLHTAFKLWSGQVLMKELRLICLTGHKLIIAVWEFPTHISTIRKRIWRKIDHCMLLHSIASGEK